MMVPDSFLLFKTPAQIHGGYRVIAHAAWKGIITAEQRDKIERDILEPAEKVVEEAFDEYNAENKR
jgi:hypothetical protein